MNAALRQEIEIFVTGLLLFLVVGFFSGHLAFWLIFGLSLYVAWNFYNLNRLTRWLSSPAKQVPETIGVWDEVYYQLHHLYQRQRKAKRKLSAIVTRFQESTQALPYATIVLNKDKEIKWFNNAAKKMFNLSSGHDFGQRIDNLVRLPRFMNYIKNEKYGDPLELEINQQQIRLTITPYGNGQYLLGAHDITQRKKLETMRRDFIANASHELRTPLTVISGYLEAIQEVKDEKLRLPLERIQEQAERMQTILEELISLSRLESSDEPEEIEEINVGQLVETVYQEAISMDKSQHNIEKQVEPVVISGNREELRTVLSNLVTNAIRYSDEGSTIKIFTINNDAYAGFGVEDKGVGISYEHIHRLTERFYRVDPGRSREQGGTGLGLAIVKHILDRHNARLSVKSKPGEGSVFECLFDR